MEKIHGATNYKEYYEFIYQNTNLTMVEAFDRGRYFWNYGIHKYEAVKQINAAVRKEEA